MSRLDRLLRPRHIAVLGAGWALNVIEQCRKMGFAGPVWPVHPTKAEIGGMKAYASLADLPEAPDATFIGVNRFATIEVVEELRRMGAGGAICFASGWTEAGEAGLQDKLVAAAGDMPILGPNCYGVINYLDGALLWPDQHGGVRVEKGVALVSQSSNIVINLGMQQRGLPVAYVACLGNAAVVGLAELTGALLDDPKAAKNPCPAGTLDWGGAWGHNWVIDPTNRISILVCTNTAPEGCNGPFRADVLRAVYN